MPDEFSFLPQASWVEEEAYNAGVAASIAANVEGSRELADLQAAVQHAWNQLQRAETSLQSLTEELEEARCSHDASVNNGLEVLGGDSRSRINNRQSLQSRVAELAFNERVAQRELKQQESELSKAEKNLVSFQQRQKARTAAAVAAAMGQRPGGVDAGRDLPLDGTTTAAAGIVHPPVHVIPSLRTTQRQPLVAASRRAPLRREVYAGGEVLPSIHRVHVTRADIRSKRLRYADDTNVDDFYARQEKRQRLEATVRELLHYGPEGPRGAAGANDVIDVDELMECEDVEVQEVLELKQESLLHASNPSPSAETSVVKEEEQSGKGRKLKKKASTKKEEEGAADAPGETLEVVPGIRMATSTYERLLDYQKDGLRWLLHLHSQRAGGILGDEMGLGKTIQIAALLHALGFSGQLRGPALIVVPMTVIRQWVAELHRWAPYLRVCVMHDSSQGGQTRESLIASVVGTPAVVITTYAALRLQCQLLHRGGFHYLILDEGHKISNPEAGLTLAAKSFTTPHRILLSGSPIQNSLKELWCLFDFVRPGLLGTMSRFVDEFEVPIHRSKNVRATPLALATAVECARELQQHLAPFLLRRLKRQVQVFLPRKVERVIRVPLSDEQLKEYIQLVSSPAVQELMSETGSLSMLGADLDRDGRDRSGSLHVAGRNFHLRTRDSKLTYGLRLQSFRVMNQLRQICNHVDIFRVQQGEADTEHNDFTGVSAAPPSGRSRAASKSFRSNCPVNLGGSAKLSILQQMLIEWRRHGHRALIFSQTRMMLDIIENLCEQEQHRYIRMDGTTPGTHRQELMDRFNEDDSIFLALLTTKVGGLGVNLTGADRVVLFDPDWNPVTDIQARERAWRIGQTREVCVYRLVTSGSLEEAILRRQLAKTYVTEKVLEDPTLQRFFHNEQTFTDNFLLGSEYDSRIPPEKKHIMVAYDFREDGDCYRDFSRQNHEGKEEDASMSDMEDEGIPPPGEGGASSPLEREFGTILSVREEATESASSPVMKAEADASQAGVQEGETHLLKGLIDGYNVELSGSDRTARRLARMKASQTLQRVVDSSSEQGSPRTMADQQREFQQMTASEEGTLRQDSARGGGRERRQQTRGGCTNGTPSRAKPPPQH